MAELRTLDIRYAHLMGDPMGWDGWRRENAPRGI